MLKLLEINEKYTKFGEFFFIAITIPFTSLGKGEDFLGIIRGGEVLNIIWCQELKKQIKKDTLFI